MKAQSYHLAVMIVVLFGLSSYPDSYAAAPDTIKSAVAVRSNSPRG